MSAGGVDNDTTISGGGELDVLAGATANGTNVQGGTLKLFGGGSIHGATINSFGSLELISGASIGDTNFQSNTNLQLGPGEVLSNFGVWNGLNLDVLSGGAAVSATTSGGSDICVLGRIDHRHDDFELRPGDRLLWRLNPEFHRDFQAASGNWGFQSPEIARTAVSTATASMGFMQLGSL